MNSVLVATSTDALTTDETVTAVKSTCIGCMMRLQYQAWYALYKLSHKQPNVMAVLS